MAQSLGVAGRLPEGSAERSTGQPGDRNRAAPQRGALVVVPPVEQLRRGVHRAGDRLVVGVPPEVAQARARPGHELHVDALPEAELGVRAAEAGLLDTAPGAGAGAV